MNSILLEVVQFIVVDWGQRLDYYPGCWYEIGVAKKRESNACALTLIAENIFESFARKKKTRRQPLERDRNHITTNHSNSVPGGPRIESRCVIIAEHHAISFEKMHKMEGSAEKVS